MEDVPLVLVFRTLRGNQQTPALSAVYPEDGTMTG